jgi:RsiW-degrading membrane proteinase PrsW (M82 family)
MRNAFWKRSALAVVGAVLIVIFFVWMFVRDHSSLAHFPEGEPVRLVINLIAWGGLILGVSAIATSQPWRRDRRDDNS